MNSAESLPPEPMLIQLLLGGQMSKIIAVIEKTGVADLLLNGPASTETLAKQIGAVEEPLCRMLRTLATIGIFIEVSPNTFANTDASRLLTGPENSWPRALVRWIHSPLVTGAWQQLDATLRTGQPGAVIAFGETTFEYVARHPDQAKIFNAAMTSTSAGIARAILAVYDFASVNRIVDVGGGEGGLLSGIAAAHPHLDAVVFDRDTVIASARSAAGTRPANLSFESGSFLDGVPTDADRFFLKHVIHDWSDDACATILGHCTRELREEGRVVVIEHVLVDGPAGAAARLLDIDMLVMHPGARQRTAEEFQTLFTRAGLGTITLTPLMGTLTLIEAGRAVQ